MRKAENKIIGVVIGLLIIVGTFVIVFGNPIKKLSVQDDTATVVDSSGGDTSASSETTKPVATPTPKPTPTPTPKPTTDNPKPITNIGYPSSGNSSGSGSSSSGGYTLSQISTHDSATSCWSAINGNVYDLTDWVDRHPGGRMAILMICGKDGSPLFNMQHGSSGRVSQILNTFKIGSLKA